MSQDEQGKWCWRILDPWFDRDPVVQRAWHFRSSGGFGCQLGPGHIQNENPHSGIGSVRSDQVVQSAP